MRLIASSRAESHVQRHLLKSCESIINFNESYEDKVIPHLSVNACCVSVSVSVRPANVWTPGTSARNDILTD